MALDKERYYNYFEICKMEEIPEGSAKGAIGLGLEGINKIAKLKSIAHLFREFPNGERKQYGILKKHYDRWKRTGNVPKVSTGRPPKWKTNDSYENLNIPILKSLYSGKLKKVVDNANAVSVVKLTYRDAVYLAIEEFCMRRPQFLDGDK